MVWITKRFLIAAALLALSYGGALADAAGPILMQQAAVRMSQCAMETLVSTTNPNPSNAAVFVMA